MPPGSQRLRGQLGVRVVWGGDHDDLDVRIAHQGVRAGYRFLEAVPLRRATGGQAAGRGDRDERSKPAARNAGSNVPVVNAPARAHPIPGVPWGRGPSAERPRPRPSPDR